MFLPRHISKLLLLLVLGPFMNSQVKALLMLYWHSRTITALNGITGFGFDLVRGTKTLGLVKSSFPSGKYLFAGVVDGRNIWANDLAASLAILEDLASTVGKGILLGCISLR